LAQADRHVRGRELETARGRAGERRVRGRKRERAGVRVDLLARAERGLRSVERSVVRVGATHAELRAVGSLAARAAQTEAQCEEAVLEPALPDLLEASRTVGGPIA